MAKKIICAVSLVLMIIAMSACGAKDGDADSMHGTWRFCGVVEEGSEYKEENIIKDDEFLVTYGVDEMPSYQITIDGDGIKGMFDNVPETEIGEVETINGHQFRQKITCNVLDGKQLDEPIVEDIYCTLEGGYLFIESTFNDEEYDTADINVYEKVKL